MMRLADGTLAVSELELIEPGLYLDVLPANAEPFADLVAARARRALDLRADPHVLHSLGSSAKHEAGTLDMRVTTRSGELRSVAPARKGLPGQPGPSVAGSPSSPYPDNSEA